MFSVWFIYLFACIFVCLFIYPYFIVSSPTSVSIEEIKIYLHAVSGYAFNKLVIFQLFYYFEFLFLIL